MRTLITYRKHNALPRPSPRGRENKVFVFKVLFFGEDLGEASRLRVRLYMVSIIFFLATFSSCTEKDNEPLLDIIPKITLKEVEPRTVVQFKDSIKMVIEYEDGDGDIGYWNADSLPLAVHDLRLANPDYFYVPPLTPDTNSLAITGTILITIRNTFLLGNGTEETTRFEIKLKDRAGHFSNTLTTPEVTITR